MEDIERFPFQIEIENEKTISVIVEGRKPNCYLCGSRGHIKKECPLYEFTAEQKETQSGEKEKEHEGKNSENKEKEITEKLQEKGSNSALKDNENKGKKIVEKEQNSQGGEVVEKEPRQKQEKEKESTLKEREKTGKEQEKGQNQEKGKDGMQKGKETTGKEHKAQGRETTDKEPKRQEKEKERRESKKREREKPREEKKEEVSPKRKTRENAGTNRKFKYYGTLIHHRHCEEMEDLINVTNGYTTDFLDKDPSTWKDDSGYKSGLEKLEKTVAVKDDAGRGIKLIHNYNNILTKDETEKQFVLQIVTKNCKSYPTATKSSLMQK
ncbi:XP_043252248.1uncharacterized protein LOC122397258 [Octopus vulgaris]|uniref:XP_043252248.1uncharacterized protein LOC122397258 n=1 Tax=Octopus vulgaris TaxID=6645 RepID=A0AA36B096_OCTVU|nr:XP_043252248.1uncharacterized protein LOC122397258 [Octopus vulgaris]